MLEIYRATDLQTGKVMPLVMVQIGVEDIVKPVDSDEIRSCVGLTPDAARHVARQLEKIAREIEEENASRPESR